MLCKKKVFLKKENRNENLTATAKESKYTTVQGSCQRSHPVNSSYLTITQKISNNIQQCCYHKSKRPIFILYGESDRRMSIVIEKGD